MIMPTPIAVPAPLFSNGKSLIPPRRPSLVRKRHAEDESEDEFNSLTLQSPVKKVKMDSFATDELQLPNPDEISIELAIQDVRSALEDCGWGDSSAYEDLKARFDTDYAENSTMNISSVKTYFRALTANVSLLNKSRLDLVQAILHYPWLDKDKSLVSIAIKLFAALATTHGAYINDVLSMLVVNLTSAPPSINLASPESPGLPRSIIYSRVHMAIKYLLQLIPSASSQICPSLRHRFPQPQGSRRDHILYTHNILKIIAYAPELHIEILTLITDKVVKLDVQVQTDIEELEDDISDGLIQDIPTLSGSPFEEFDEDDFTDDENEDEDANVDTIRTKTVKRYVENMDAIIDILFSHYDSNFVDKETGGKTHACVDLILTQFSTILLPTLRSRHTQFLLFHFMQQSQTLIDLFVGTCAEKILDKSQPMLIRQNAAAYLASFVARGMHVPTSIVRDVFDYISGELKRLRKSYEPKCAGPELRRYSTFYCLVQALLYMFCFRWSDLELQTDDDSLGSDDDGLDPTDCTFSYRRKWVTGVKETFSANIFSKLNPLKVCAPSIVDEFARMAKDLGLIYVYHLLETNKRIRLTSFMSATNSTYLDRESALTARQGECDLVLDAYFPFDPYNLPISKRWLAGDYRSWASLDEDEGDASDEVHEDTDVDDGAETDDSTASE